MAVPGQGWVERAAGSGFLRQLHRCERGVSALDCGRAGAGRLPHGVAGAGLPPGSRLRPQDARNDESAARTIAVLSPAYFDSKFGEAEWRTAFADDPDGEFGKLVPVKVQPCRPPGLLRTTPSCSRSPPAAPPSPPDSSAPADAHRSRCPSRTSWMGRPSGRRARYWPVGAHPARSDLDRPVTPATPHRHQRGVPGQPRWASSVSSRPTQIPRRRAQPGDPRRVLRVLPLCHHPHPGRLKLGDPLGQQPATILLIAEPLRDVVELLRLAAPSSPPCSAWPARCGPSARPTVWARPATGCCVPTTRCTRCCPIRPASRTTAITATRRGRRGTRAGRTFDRLAASSSIGCKRRAEHRLHSRHRAADRQRTRRLGR